MSTKTNLFNKLELLQSNRAKWTNPGITLQAKTTRKNVVEKLDLGILAGILAIDMLSKSGSRPSVVNKYTKALLTLKELVDGDFPVLQDDALAKEALSKRDLE